MKTRIKYIASIQTGIYETPNITGNVYYIQARHFNKEGVFDPTVKPNLKLDDKLKNHLLQSGDILLAAKGLNNFSVVYNNGIGSAVASSMFLVIRVKSPKIISPDYLSWFFNHPQSQKYFQACSKGSAITSITKSVVEDLEIAIPSIEKQKAILKIHNLHLKEIKIKSEIESLREKQIQQHIINALK